MTAFGFIILRHPIKAITIFLTESRTIPTLDDPRLRFLKLARITTTPRETIIRPPFTGNTRIGELTVQTSMER